MKFRSEGNSCFGRQKSQGGGGKEWQALKALTSEPCIFQVHIYASAKGVEGCDTIESCKQLQHIALHKLCILMVRDNTTSRTVARLAPYVLSFDCRLRNNSMHRVLESRARHAM